MEILELDSELAPVGTTVIHLAVNSGNVEGLRSLLDRDLSLINRIDCYNNTPLAVALNNNRLQAAQVLIQSGANLNAKYEKDGQRTLAQTIIDTPSFYPLLKSVIGSNATFNCDLSSIIPILAYSGEADMLEVVLSTYKVRVDWKDHLQCTALHYASHRGFTKVVKVLLEHTATTSIKNSSSSTALHLACSAGHLDIVTTILEADTSTESTKSLLNAKNVAGNTPVTCALSRTHFELVQYLLTTCRECLNLDQLLPDGHTLAGLIFYLRYFSGSNLIKVPFRSSLPCLSSEEAQWLLHDSVHVNDTDAVRAAVDQGASVECLDYMHQIPLIVAAKIGSVEMCKCLVGCGADSSVVDVSGKTALIHAIEHGKHKVVDYFLSQNSLHPLDPHSLATPLCTPAMVAVLVSHFEKNNVIFGSDWLAWLALAVPIAPKDVFSALVSAIAPNDWIQQMLVAKPAKADTGISTSKFSRVAKHPVLPAYIQEERVDESLKPQPKLVRSFSQPRKWYFTRPPPSTRMKWTIKCLPRPKKPPSSLRKKGKPFGLCKSRITHSSMIHEAALNNVDVLQFILASCEEAELQEKVLLSRDETGRTALELVLPQFDLISDAVSSLQLSAVAGLDEYLRQEFTLPESVLFEEALIHYLCVGDVFLSQQRHKFLSPLQAWPLWYLQQQVNAVCVNHKSDYLLLSELEDRKKLLLLLLHNNYLRSVWVEEEYPPPLFAAIQSKTLWAVEPLLLHGAAPATHYHGRFAIEEAAKRSQPETVCLLLQNGFTPFLALSDNTALFSSLTSALAPLIWSGYTQCALSLIESLHLGQYLWCSSSAPNFLYELQAQCNGSEVYETVLRDFVAFLCTEMVHWESRSANVTSAILHNLEKIRCRSFFHRENMCGVMKHLLLLIEAISAMVRSYPYPSVEFSELFAVFCDSGNHEMIHFLLEGSPHEVVEQFINKKDKQGMSPLVHAACSGHLNVVKLLLDYGVMLTSNAGLSPLAGALLFLALAPYNAGGDTMGKTCNYTYHKRRKSLEPYRNLLPRTYSFSCLCDDIAGATELVKLLLPPQSVSIYTHLATFPTPYRQFHTLLVLLASARVSSVLEPLLRRIAQEAMPSSPFQSSPMENTGFTNRSVLSTALKLAPVNTDKPLFEDFLLRYISDGELRVIDIFAAARKGYWKVIDAAVTANRLTSNISNDKLDKSSVALLETCRLAIKVEKRDLLCALVQVAQSAQMLTAQWWPCLVRTAVHQPITMCDLILAGCEESLCLQAAARWGNSITLDILMESLPGGELAKHFVDVLEVAAQCNQLAIIQLLFNKYQKYSEITIIAGLPQTLSFWLWVLFHSARNGHQSLALQAVACISEQEMHTIVSQHTLLHEILYYCCYWGLSHVLACIPYDEDALLVRNRHDSPLEAAIANGRLGCIPNPSQFPLGDNVSSWLSNSPFTVLSNTSMSDLTSTTESGIYMLLTELLTGLYPHMLSVEDDTRTTKRTSDAVKYKSALCRPNAFTAYERLTGNFCAPILVYAVQNGQLDLLDEAIIMGDSNLAEQVLRQLVNSDLLSNYCSHSSGDTLIKAVMAGHTACLELLLRSGDVFVKQLSAVNSAGQNVLHSAVMARGHSECTLTVLVDWLGDAAPDMSCAEDKEGNSPLSLAFCCGEYDRAAVLLRVSQESSNWLASQDWMTEAKEARGWNRVILSGLGVQFTEHQTALHPVQLNIRKMKSTKKMFRKAIDLRFQSHIVSALLRASCGMLLTEANLLSRGIMHPDVLMFLSDCPTYVPVPSMDATATVCKNLKQRNCSVEIKLLINIYNRHQEVISMDLNKVFITACASSRLEVVSYLLENVTSIRTRVLQEGINESLACGAGEVAAAILVSEKVTNHGLVDESTSWMTSSPVQLMFVPDKDYQSIVEDFFGSLAQSNRITFSEQWLVHKWGPYQMQLLQKKMGYLSNVPSNPWMLVVQWREHPHTVTVTIDWEAFTNCLDVQPAPYDFTPLLVEAVVFSPSVLGQLCITKDNLVYNLADFFDSSQSLISLVVSAVTWPQSPSSCLSSSSEGLLILSYNTKDRVFIFPPIVRTERGGDESYSTDSGMQSFCITDTSLDTKCDELSTSILSNDLRDLCKYYQRKLKRKHNTSTDIAVDGVMDMSVLLSVLESCTEAIHLSTLPTVAYSSIWKCEGRWCLPKLSPMKELFSHIGININAGEITSTCVSVVDAGLDISISLAIDSSIHLQLAALPPYEPLLKQIVDCALTREVQMLQGRLSQQITTSFVPMVEYALKCPLDANSVRVVFEDISGNTTDLGLTTVKHLRALKSLSKINKFLVYFCDILRAYSNKPKVFTDIRRSLQRGFRLVISDSNDTGMTYQSSLLQLTMLTGDLYHLQSPRALLSLTASLLKLSQKSISVDVKHLLADVPCPFLTYVDLTRSKSFLYPRVGSVSKMIVQVISYGEEKLNLPLKYNFPLYMSIRSCDSKKIISGTSVKDPSVHMASNNLLVTTSEDGKFEVMWTPTEEGLHTISLYLNGLQIEQPFKRVFVANEANTSCGKRQVSAGSDMVFVASHIGCKCPCSSQKSKVVLTKGTAIEPSPFLKNVPGFKTFTAPFPSTGSLQTHPPPLNSVGLLRQAVSTMASLSPLPNHYSSGLDSPLPLLHHISITAAWDGCWSHISYASVTLHMCAEDKAHIEKVVQRFLMRPSNIGCVLLGSGMYRISVQCQIADTYRVFASCPFCQSVMKIHWLDEQTFYPQPIYVLPGPFSRKESRISDLKTGKYERVRNNKPGQPFYVLPGPLSQRKSSACDGACRRREYYKPGEHAFSLHCCDEYGNSHTAGGAIKKAVVKGAGRIVSEGGKVSFAALLKFPQQRHDAECAVEHIGRGRYTLKCTLHGAGKHQLIVTDALGKTHPMATVQVVSGPVYPPNCRMDPKNVYETTLFTLYTFHLYAFDRSFNPCCLCRNHVLVLVGSDTPYFELLPAPPPANRVAINFAPQAAAVSVELRVSINGEFIGGEPKKLLIKSRSLEERLDEVREMLAQPLRDSQTVSQGVATIDRSNLLEDALRNHAAFRSRHFYVRFRGESGIDEGGVSREFFHLLSKELVNPQYALFQSTNGLYRPSPHSSVNPTHLSYFNLCGKMLAKMLCDNYRTVIHFTPAVYKFLLGQQCTLDDLEIDDPSLHKGLMAVASCNSDESLDQLAMNFTTSYAHFGSLQTVELVKGGNRRNVTLKNRDQFVEKFCQWHLIGCTQKQLDAMYDGFNPPSTTGPNHDIYWRELELLLCGRPVLDISFLKRCARYEGYDVNSQVVVWLWQVLQSFSGEEWSKFLLFITGSASVPIAEAGQWKMVVKRGSQDESLLPTAATCFATLHLPCYTSKNTLAQKLKQAINYGHLHFLTH